MWHIEVYVKLNIYLDMDAMFLLYDAMGPIFPYSIVMTDSEIDQDNVPYIHHQSIDSGN